MTLDSEFVNNIRKACEEMEDNPTFASINLKLILQEVNRQGHLQPQKINQAKRLLIQTGRAPDPNKLFKHDEDESDYEQSLHEEEGYMQIQTPQDKFKVLGTNSRGQKIYRISDFYLAHNHIVEEIYRRRIGQIIEQERKRRRQDSTLQDTLLAMINKFIENQNEGISDQTMRQQKCMSLQELEDIICQTGQSRKNFFLHYHHNRQKTTLKRPQLNPHLANPLFISKLQRLVHTQHNFKPQEEEVNTMDESKQAEESSEEHVMEDLGIVTKMRSDPPVQGEGQLWGTLVDVKPQRIQFVIKDDEDQQGEQRLLKDEIIQKFNYYNPELNQGWKKPIRQLDRLEIDLNTPGLHLEKLQNLIRKKKQEFEIPPPEKERSKKPCRGVRRKQQQDESQIVEKSSLPAVQYNLPRDEATELTLMDMLMEYKKSQKQPTNITHSQVANRLTFVKFVIDTLEFKDFHRFIWHQQRPTASVSLVRSTIRKPKYSGLKINHEAIDSFEKFRTQNSLSCRQGTLILVQQIQENPLMLSDSGMCTKMVMHVDYKKMYNQVAARALSKKPQCEDIEGKRGTEMLVGDEGINLFREELIEKLGPLGTLYLEENGRTGLLGHSNHIGAAVLENRMYGQVAIRQNQPTRDFLLLRGSDGKWFLRKIDHLYIGGQIQPKMDFFSPDSRSISSFLTNYLKSFIKLAFEDKSRLDFETLRDTFRTINQHNIRKTLKHLNAETKDSRIYEMPLKMEKELDVTPQQVCLYEKMQNTLYIYKLMGIQLLRVPDKLKQIVALHFKKYPDDLKKYVLAKIICDQLHSCPWYLTQSYKSSQQGQGKLQLQGYGDPTNGHGGISFIKRPQKKRIQKQDEPEEDRGRGVTGTNADLRKLRNDVAEKMLLQQGMSIEDVSGMNRWQKVDTLKQIASKTQMEGLSRFRRQQRATKKMKKQAYQKEIDKMFNILVKNLTASDIAEEQIKEIKHSLTPLTIEEYMSQQKDSWQQKRIKLRSKPSTNEVSQYLDDGQDDEIFDSNS